MKFLFRSASKKIELDKDDTPAKVGIIQEWKSKEMLNSYAQERVSSVSSAEKANNKTAFRKAMLFMTAAVIMIILLSLIYTRKLSGYVADPIEL